MDYRDLLKKYITYVGQAEGTDFLQDCINWCYKEILTEDEFQELIKLAEEANKIPYNG